MISPFLLILKFDYDKCLYLLVLIYIVAFFIWDFSGKGDLNLGGHELFTGENNKIQGFSGEIFSQGFSVGGLFLYWRDDKSFDKPIFA